MSSVTSEWGFIKERRRTQLARVETGRRENYKREGFRREMR